MCAILEKGWSQLGTGEGCGCISDDTAGSSVFRRKKVGREMKRIRSSLLFFMMICFLLIPRTTNAAEFHLPYAKSTTVYLGGAYNPGAIWYTMDLGKLSKNAVSVTAASSNAGVMDVLLRDGVVDYVLLGAKEIGKSTVTVKITYQDGKTKTYKTKVKVAKYVNPVKTFKIGSKDYAKNFGTYRQSQFTVFPSKKAKVTVKLSSEWKIKDISFNHRQYTYLSPNMVKVKNGKYFDFSKYVKASTKDYTFELNVTAVNKKTNLEVVFRATSY